MPRSRALRTLAPTTASKVKMSQPPRASIAPKMSAPLLRPKTPKVPLPSAAAQGPNQAATAVSNRSNRAFGKQQRKIRNALGAQAGNPQQRGGIPSQPIAGNAVSAMPQAPGSSSIAADQDAQY